MTKGERVDMCTVCKEPRSPSLCKGSLVLVEEHKPCGTYNHKWYKLPGNFTRKCENCELEENIR